MAKGKTDKEKVVEKLLSQQGKKLTDWKKEVIQDVQISFFKGADKELEEYAIDREMGRLLISESKKRMNLT